MTSRRGCAWWPQRSGRDQPFPDGVISEVKEFVGYIPVPMPSTYWDEVQKIWEKRKKSAPVIGLFADLPQKEGAAIDSSGRVEHCVIVPTAEQQGQEYEDRVSEYAMDAWEKLAEWPETWESLLRTLMLHGVQFKPAADQASIVKKERAEWSSIEHGPKV